MRLIEHATHTVIIVSRRHLLYDGPRLFVEVNRRCVAGRREHRGVAIPRYHDLHLGDGAVRRRAEVLRHNRYLKYNKRTDAENINWTINACPFAYFVLLEERSHSTIFQLSNLVG